MNRKLQIFISSTYTDLKDERQAAVQAILKAGHIPAGMELFTAGDVSQMDTIKKWIDESDVFMLILGGRYGSVEPTTGKSYTHLEYEYALETRKPLFATVINDAALEKKLKDHGSSAFERDHPEKLREFRSVVLSNICAFFDDQKDIKLTIHETIPELHNKHQCTGWVSGRELTNLEITSEEVRRLKEENALLKSQISELQVSQREKQKAIKSDGIEDQELSFPDLRDILLKTIIPVREGLDLKDQDSKPILKLDACNAFVNFTDAFSTGVHNSYDMTLYHKFLFFDVAPKLQIHGLVGNEKVAGVTYRRIALTKKGERFAAWLHKETLELQTKKPAAGKKT